MVLRNGSVVANVSDAKPLIQLNLIPGKKFCFISFIALHLHSTQFVVGIKN